jgi:predicted nucleic acid-binding protein
MSGIIETASQYRLIGIDTSIFIYHFEGRTELAHIASAVINELETGTLTGVTSIITVAELLVRPLQLRNSSIAAAYQATLESLPGLELAIVDRQVALRAARVRADHGLHVADAIHVATSLVHGATAFLTNDRRLRRINDLDVLLLDDFRNQEPGSAQPGQEEE